MKFFSATTAILLISVAISGLLTPQSARAEGLAQEEYIKVEVRGKLNNEIMAIGGETYLSIMWYPDVCVYYGQTFL